MKVLIVRVGAMGDVLHGLPAVAALKRARPEWELGWCIDPRWAPLAAAMDTNQRGPYVSRVHLAETKAWSAAPVSLATVRSVWSLRKELRAQRYDLAVDLQGTLRSSVIAKMSGAGDVAGFADPREAMAASLYRRRMKRLGAHVVEQNAALLGEACGVELAPGAVELPHEGWAEEWAGSLFGGSRFCVLSPNAGWGAKQWPVERFAVLATALRERGFHVAVNAPRADDVLASELIRMSKGAAELVVCNVTGLIALMRRASLMVGGDTGPVHLAAALGTPVVALFGPTDPGRNGPWGQGPRVVLRDAASVPSYKRNNAVDPGLARIGVEQVLDAIKGSQPGF